MFKKKTTKSNECKHRSRRKHHLQNNVNYRVPEIQPSSTLLLLHVGVWKVFVISLPDSRYRIVTRIGSLSDFCIRLSSNRHEIVEHTQRLRSIIFRLSGQTYFGSGSPFDVVKRYNDNLKTDYNSARSIHEIGGAIRFDSLTFGLVFYSHLFVLKIFKSHLLKMSKTSIRKCRLTLVSGGGVMTG